jgi:hypothetical protein
MNPPNPALRCNRLGHFRYPPSKRHRSKSKPEEAPGDQRQRLHEAAQSPPYPEDGDLEADAEAAAFMHG